MRHQLALRYVDAVARAGSIRKAAERLAITSTALNRRILAMEEELGVPLFERLPGGVRPSAAGELLVRHARDQFADMERVRSQIADLAGERRGHVAIVCGQACMQRLLPRVIGDYRRDHPAVTFSVRVCGRDGAEPALADLSADVAMVYEGQWGTGLQIVAESEQSVHLLCARSHPLAGRSAPRLRDCLEWPMALPTRANSIRPVLERAADRIGRTLEPAIESDNFDFLRRTLRDGRTVSFQVSVALPREAEVEGLLRHAPLERRDVPAGRLLIGHLRGRTLPVAAARFLDRVSTALADGEEGDAGAVAPPPPYPSPAT